MRKVPIKDVLCLVVPPVLGDPTRPQVEPVLAKHLDRIAKDTIWRQYADRPVQPTITDIVADWLITRDPADVEKFQPAHDCAACRAGNDQALAQLRAHPEQWIAMANLSYTEVWAS